MNLLTDYDAYPLSRQRMAEAIAQAGRDRLVRELRLRPRCCSGPAVATQPLRYAVRRMRRVLHRLEIPGRHSEVLRVRHCQGHLNRARRNLVSDMKTEIRRRYARYATQEPCSSRAPSSVACCGSESSTPLGCGMPLRYAALRPGEVVLDLGSGPGLEVLAAARQVGPAGRAIGLDMTPEMIEAARARTPAEATDLQFRFGDIEKMPLAEAEVDVIISNCVINLAVDYGELDGTERRLLTVTVTGVKRPAPTTEADHAELRAPSGSPAGGA